MTETTRHDTPLRKTHPRREPVIGARSDSETPAVGNHPDARPGSAGELSDIAVARADVIAPPLSTLGSPRPEPGISSDHDAISARPAQHDERTPAGLGRRRVLVGLAGAAAVSELAVAGWEVRRPPRGSPPAAKSAVRAPAQASRAGTLVWRFGAGASIGSRPAVSAGVVYFASDDFNVYALDARHGAVLWSFRTGGPVESSPAVVDGVVYVGSQDWNVYALNASSGTRLWEVPTGGPIDSSPAVSGGVAYIGSGDGSIYAGSDDGYVYALNAGNLADVIWSYDTGGPVQFSSPAVTGGVAYIGSHDDNVYALTADHGREVWSFPIRGPVDSSPAVAAGVVYIGSDDSNLYALAADHGKKLWSFPTNGHVFSSPAVAAGVVYVGSDDHHIYALRT
jgi:outer membrane protein assembly factor BamB